MHSVSVNTHSAEHDHSYWIPADDYCMGGQWEYDPPEHEIEFDPAPSGLRQLSLRTAHWPPALFAASAQTLTSLTLDIDRDHLFNQLSALTPHLTQLTVLRIPVLLARRQVFSLPPAFVDFVSSLPRLAELEILQISAQQLEQLLQGLDPDQPLSLLKTRVVTIAPDNSNHADNYERWTEERVPTLERCGEMLVELGAEAWWLGVTVMEMEHTCEHVLDDEGLQVWAEVEEGWNELVAEVRGNGVDLVLWPC